MKKVLIIGGDSFIAKTFINNYKDKFRFIIISRKLTHDNNEFIVDNFFDLDSHFFSDIDVIINFAAIVHKTKVKDNELYKRINYELPVHLAKKSYEAGIKHFIQMSSVAVYGNVSQISYNTICNPCDLYGKYKLLTDEMLLQNYSGSKMKVSCVRPSMVYGGGRSPGNLSKLIKLTKYNIPLPFKGISNNRQFCNIHLLTKTIHYIIENGLENISIVADKEGLSTSNIITLVNDLRKKKDRQFKSVIFWKLLSKVNPDLTDKLTSDLKIENSIDYLNLNIGSKENFSYGLKEMIENL